jgi:hypothetical protein
VCVGGVALPRPHDAAKVVMKPAQRGTCHAS